MHFLICGNRFLFWHQLTKWNFRNIWNLCMLNFHYWQWGTSYSNSLSSLYSSCAMWMFFSIFADCLHERRTLITHCSIRQVRVHCCILVDICFWDWRQGKWRDRHNMLYLLPFPELMIFFALSFSLFFFLSIFFFSLFFLYEDSASGLRFCWHWYLVGVKSGLSRTNRKKW